MAEIAVITDDIFLFRKIELALKGRDTVMLPPESKTARAALVLRDLRRGGERNPGEIAIVSEASDADDGALVYPFRLEDLRALATGGGASASRLTLSEDARLATLDGERIPLTEVEGRLLLAIMAGGGDFVSREELILAVWGEGAKEGILNVYVHYLREKLEFRGEKVITASRKSGYKIEERYLGGKSLC